MSNDLKSQVKAFLYELNNTQHEYGFAPTEQWSLDLANPIQKKQIENKFYPVLSLTIIQDQIMEVLDLLQDKLTVVNIKDELTSKKISKDAIHLVAYCTSKLK